MQRLLPRGCMLLALVLVLLAGCRNDRPQIGPPNGWTSSGDRWWRQDAPLNLAFRDLGTLEAMRVRGTNWTDSMVVQPGAHEDGRKVLVKRSLIRLYRTDPETVDSLFEQYVAPIIQQAPAHADLGLFVRELRKESYQVIRDHYREPIPTRHLGRDVAVPYPDSLKEKSIGGTVRTQVYLNERGEPLAIELLAGAHPILDSIALRATTQMRWEPAYRVYQGRWRAVPSWARFNVTFGEPH